MKIREIYDLQNLPDEICRVTKIVTICAGIAGLENNFNFRDKKTTPSEEGVVEFWRVNLNGSYL